jgi:hypothetical protein
VKTHVLATQTITIASHVIFLESLWVLKMIIHIQSITI